MGVKGCDPELDLLHREADGDLTEAEWAQLTALSQDPSFAQTRQRLRQATAALRALPPPTLPRSLAHEVASEIAWAAWLTTAPPPPRPAPIAAQVAADVRTSSPLDAPPGLPHSLAPAVASDVAWAVRLRQSSPSLPISVAQAISARIAHEASAERTPPDTVLPRHNPAPLLLVVGLLIGLTLLGLTSAWPNLAAGAAVLQ